MQRRGALVPFQVRVDHMGIGRHHGADPMGDAAQLDRIGADDAEGDRPDHRRAEQQLVHPHPRLGEFSLVDVLLQGGHDLVPRRGILRHGNDLGEGGRGRLGVGAEEEARRPGADVGGQAAYLRQRGENGLELPDRSIRGADAAALWKVDGDQHFRAVRTGEELLLHQQGHAGDGQRQ
ncbi:hypothetical protein D3C86_1661890 [compost metagenome]